MLVAKKHCYYCKRSCCDKCSVKQIIDGDLSNKRNSCEYCDLKIKNTQLEEFYQVGSRWRQIDSDVLAAKRKWYLAKIKDLRDDIASENESGLIKKVKLSRDLADLENELRDLQEQIDFMRSGKERLSKRLYAKQQDKLDMQHRIARLRSAKANLIMQKTQQENLISRSIKRKEVELLRAVNV